MKNNLPHDEETRVEQDPLCQEKASREQSADDHRAITPGQIRHLLEKGYFLGSARVPRPFVSN